MRPGLSDDRDRAIPFDRKARYDARDFVAPGRSKIMTAVLSEGDPAPGFDLPGAAGERLALSSFAGKKLALYFYPKDDTSGCTKEAIAFNGLREKFAEAGTAIVGLSPDSVKAHDKFREKYDLKLPLASDAEKKVLEAYGVWVEKSMYGRKYMGVERATFLIGANGRIVRIWRKVKVPGHAEAVLAAAQAL
jgi:thioredoxin-dependent peroxiredoxin